MDSRSSLNLRGLSRLGRKLMFDPFNVLTVWALHNKCKGMWLEPNTAATPFSILRLYVLVMSLMRFRVNPHSSCLNVKELLARSRCEIWFWIQAQLQSPKLLNFNIKVLLSTICHDDCSRLPHFLCYHSLYFIVAEGPVICMSPITNWWSE